MNQRLDLVTEASGTAASQDNSILSTIYNYKPLHILLDQMHSTKLPHLMIYYVLYIYLYNMQY